MMERNQPGYLNPHGIPTFLNAVGSSVRGAFHPQFQFQPTIQWFFGDKGAGEVDLLNTYGAEATFTRATTAWTKLASGLWASVASGTPRHFYSGFTTAVGAPLGYLAEGARTNSALHSRKLAAGVTATEWVESNVTAADDATGIGGVVNSASTLTVGANNGIILQSRTIASAAKTLSAFVRRKTGTGDVFITLDNDTTRTDITADINSTTYTRVSMTQTLANPVFGFKLAADTDAIEVDIVMLEDSASFASTPIPTTTAAVTRNADVLTYPTTGWLNASVGTFLLQIQPITLAASQGVGLGVFSLDDGTDNERLGIYRETDATAHLFDVDGGVSQGDFSIGALTDSVSSKLAAVYRLNDLAGSVNGGTVATDVSATIPTVTTVRLAIAQGITQGPLSIRRVSYFDQRLSNEHLQILTAG